MKSRILAAKAVFALTLALTTALPPPPAYSGGIPVFDGINLSQNILTAIESIAQTLNQIEQYRTQLQQYENQLQNTMGPSTYIWDNAKGTISRLNGLLSTIDYYKDKVGDLDTYLSAFQDLNYYRNSPCFRSTGCSAEEWLALMANSSLSYEAQKRSNDAWINGINDQQTGLLNDASTLQRLQSSAQGAAGQMQALQFANQFASAQTNQLLQIRGLLLAQQTAVATKMQAEADQKAREEAASLQFRSTSFEESDGQEW